MRLVDVANNGQEALDLVKEHSYGLIFMDCSMPIMDGFEATDCIRRYLRARRILQPMIVASTGHTEEMYVQKAWRYEMDEVIAKPTDINIIHKTMPIKIRIIHRY